MTSMTEMKLHRLELINFMNASLTIFLNGEHLAVYGANGTGKTRLNNAITYLLDNKNYDNRRDFEIKTLDEEGNVVHGMDHVVEGEFEINGKMVVLRKNYSETWKKKIGSKERQFGSNNTEYFINGVSTTMTDYQAYINSLVPEFLIRLLINPTAFNDLHWTERRKILLESFGNITDGEIITLNPALSVVPEILQGEAIDEMLPLLKKKFNLTQKEQKKVKLLLGEAARKIPDELMEISGEALMKEKLLALKEEICTTREMLEKLVHNDHRDKVRQQRNRAQEQVDTLTRSLNKLHSQKEEYEKQMLRLRNKWEVKHQETFNHQDLLTCPLCDQSIPEDDRVLAREKALKRFKQEKQQQLDAISAQGIDTSQKLELLKDDIDTIGAEHKAFSEALEKAEEAFQRLTEGTEKEETQLRNKLTALDTQEAELREKLAYVLAAEQARQRVQELEEAFNQLEEDCHSLEGQIMALEEFNRIKMELLQERVNHHFSLARFRLFKKLVSGEVTECCETLYNGVPYNSNLNHGHRIRVGLDIINALSRRFGITLPLLVDNRESVDQLPPTNAQVISLFVSAKDSVLRPVKDNSIHPLLENENVTFDSICKRNRLPFYQHKVADEAGGPGF